MKYTSGKQLFCDMWYIGGILPKIDRYLANNFEGHEGPVLCINISIFIEDGSKGFVGFFSHRLFMLERRAPSFRGELSLDSPWWILTIRVSWATSLQTAPAPLEMLTIIKGILSMTAIWTFPQTYFSPTKEGSETREGYEGKASKQSKNSRVRQGL